MKSLLILTVAAVIGLAIGAAASRWHGLSHSSDIEPSIPVANHLPMSDKKTVWIEVKGTETYQEAEQRTKQPVKDKPAVVVTKVPPQAKDLLIKAVAVCKKVGLPTDPCGRDLVAMAWKESRFISVAIGDQGRSRGFFQIQTKLHKVSVNCATDFMCAAEWTAKHLIKNGYPTLRSASLAKHNGAGPAAKRYAESVKAYSLAMIK